MSDLTSIAKREVITQGWNLFINTATGEFPNVNRHQNGVDITWKPGQARRMEQYLLNAMSRKEEPDDANVKVDLMPVLIPLGVKKTVGWVALYTAIVVGLTKTLWR